jgi:aspartate/methionine/tyrosine aminotransferase
MALGVRHVTVDVIPGGVDEGCLPTLSGMEEALQAGRKLLFLESPSRLTGATFDANSVDAIGQLVERHDAFVIWDQGVAPWAVDPPLHSIFADPSSDHRMTVIGEAWPGFGLENWFIGYIGAHRSWVDRIKTLKQIMSICTSTPAQYAALAAADLFPEWHGAQIAGFAERRAAVAAMARAAGWKILPGSTVNLIAVSGSGGLSPPAFGAGTTGLDGAAFGAPGVFGIAIADHTAAEDLAHTGDGSHLNES